ncbi:MAG: thermonuclease family protein [Alphaproteobacteria bacterium]|nr:thermonuclease family protein [Alphaproteobacteria bacterium]MBT4967147.1 thermonuclease family protein [Alphaproteobacteria bacterium]MBT5158514.1 thermonuclease family protein [Alphaproteobacteria bacterium]MBT5920375.1 thermonuclease family protein [Alphaproteobacteria bacterium]MBT6384833.1 thermonuclease family protein [Alphaproteobacteria bacterium]
MRLILHSLLLVSLLFSGFLSAHAASRSGKLVRGGEARVVSVVDGDTVVLDDQRQVRLVGIQAPKLPLGRDYVQKQPFADESKAGLKDLVLGKIVRLSWGGRRQDRHGRALAHLHLADGTWVQGWLLERGLARVYSFRDNRTRVDAMLALESAAREGREGLWSHDYYKIITASRSHKMVDTFQLVKARIKDAVRIKGRVYLNFGADWREDFTVTISPKNGRLFSKAGLRPETWSGREIRVRGWINWRNGPMIEATHPEQIEVLN